MIGQEVLEFGAFDDPQSVDAGHVGLCFQADPCGADDNHTAERCAFSTGPQCAPAVNSRAYQRPYLCVPLVPTNVPTRLGGLFELGL